MIRQTCFLLLCLGLLGGCEHAAESPRPIAAAPAAEPAVAETPVQAAPEVEKPLVQEAPPVAPAAKPAKPQVTTTRPAPAAVAPAREDAPLVLDLSLPDELLELSGLEEGVEQAPVLPPLFAEKPETISPFQISGRLISNERVDDYWDSIEGAELQFEFRQ